ncbi:Signal transduction histidine kinase [Luteibacter sp. UNC138MFCol5.1]|uniref:response regulator n=1 Tax=Luteibacter sp. UNC138MFCol5.1 TaxID=1502774 RepID=UPI0008D4457D|nr:response regulator [Luteibacter sp. UNC138MFCol5.1]SEO38843.1 Signal transduction histidine kinase [Luteibacter sp. UNC138MFCol5.1]
MTPTATTPGSRDLSWLDGAGEVGELIRSMDWTPTGLGPPESWPQSLRTVTGMLLLSPVPIVLLWGEKGIMIYNDAYSVFAGNRHPALLGSEVRKGWDEIADFNDNVMRVGLAGGTLAYKDQQLSLVRHGKPEPVWMDLDYSPVLGEDGKPAGVIAIVVETTERVLADQRERENQARLQFLDELREATARHTDADAILATTMRLLGEHLGVAVCAYADMEPDEDGFTIRGDWSRPGSPSIVGHYSLNAFGTLAVRNLHAGAPLVIDDIRAELASEEAKTFLDIGLAATVCMPLLKEGRLTALMAIHDKVPRRWQPRELALMREVTERSWSHIQRVRAEADARESERRFREELEAQVRDRTAALERSEANSRTILETSHLFQGLIDLDGTVRFANATSLAGIGRTLTEVVGLPLWLTPWFSETPGMPRTIEAAARRVAAGATENLGVVLDLPTGTRAFDLSLRPVANDDGKVVAMVYEAVEKTARVKAEQALLQMQKMEALGNLTGGIAHDFNNLLMAVRGSLELLRERLSDEPLLLRLVDNAMAGADRGSTLTRRMLAFARRQELKTERIDVHALVDGMRELMQRSLGGTIVVETHFAADLSPVEADANQLESALLNLAVNARDAMDGVGTIVIATSEAWVHDTDGPVAPGRYVRLSLSDSGAGMDDATLKRATEPFFTTKGVGKGTGLGLSMVHGLAEQLGGALLLSSRRDIGTTAEIWLPAAAAADPAVHPAVAVSAEAVPGRCSSAGSITILTVDDDDLVRATTVEMLEDLGYSVVAARSGAEALRLLEGACVDLVITDHAMPQMTGAQLAAAIRERLPDLPIVMATGYADLPPGQTLDLPRLAKPYSQATLADIVARTVVAREQAAG